jgi:predicted dehydrogenase
MTKTIKWGVIGSGGIARRRTIPEGIVPSELAELISVFDLNQEVNSAVANEFQAHAASSIDDLLRQDIDAVYIASPVDKHFQHVLACAKAKKHVLCEKALGLTVSEIEIMISICQQEGVLFGTAFMMRFHSQHKAALKLIQEGKLGKPVYARAQLSCWYPPIVGAWRQDPEMSGGGSLMDMGSHCIDLLEMFFGRVKQVSCFINNTVHDYKSEDSALVNLFFENGALASVDTFFCIPDESSKNILELYGSAGSILAKGTIGQGSGGEMTAYLAEKSERYDANQSRNSSDGISIDPVPVNTYKAEIDEFSSAILEKRLPENSAQIGLQNQKIIAACYEAARTQKVITIENEI